MTSSLKVSGALKVRGAPVDEASAMGEAELEFVLFCVESTAAHTGRDAVAVYDALAQSGVLSGYIVPCYGALHTQGKEYIVREIIEVLHERGVAL